MYNLDIKWQRLDGYEISKFKNGLAINYVNMKSFYEIHIIAIAMYI